MDFLHRFLNNRNFQSTLGLLQVEQMNEASTRGLREISQIIKSYYYEELKIKDNRKVTNDEIIEFAV